MTSSSPHGWTTALDVEAEVRRAWERGRILSARVSGEAMFPWQLRTRRPDRRELSDRFDDVRTWIRELTDESRAVRGHGYDIVWTEIEHRQLGRNRVPEGIVVPTEADALQLIGKRRATERFEALLGPTLAAFPELRPWLARHPLEVLAQGDAWPRVLDVLRFMRAHPRPQVYLRQVDLPRIDTKFLEARRKLLAELFELVLPPTAIADGSTFEARFGFRTKPALVRFRVLDRRHALAGLTDVTTTITELAAHPPPCSRVFITENEINGLAFPDHADAIVIFGLGYGLELLAQLPWLRDRTTHYWGDLDTHGFVMLDRLRAFLPDARSLLMDRETLLAHRPFWVEEPKQNPSPLTRLTPPEQALYDDLLHDRLGPHVRLEQERIGFGWLSRALSSD
jgi:hypothetical protein